LFGSHARGDARQDSDVDLCLVSESAGQQLKASRVFRNAIWEVRDCPAFTLLPITPQRLREKRESGDHFFKTVLNEGVELANEN
jgi:predicted nucleotidyltransferase